MLVVSAITIASTERTRHFKGYASIHEWNAIKSAPKREPRHYERCLSVYRTVVLRNAVPPNNLVAMKGHSMKFLGQFMIIVVCFCWCSAVTDAQTTTAAARAPIAEPAAPAVQASTDVAVSPDEATIRSNIDKYVESYNRRDTQTMANMWSPEAIYTDPRTGEGVMGRDAIKQLFDEIFAGEEDAKLAVTVESIDFVSPNVAIEKGAAVVTYSDHPAEETTYTAVHMKRDGQWVLDRVSEEEIPLPPLSNYEHLKSLEWMVGTWIDQDENTVIETDCEWTRNKNFMTRSFTMVTRDGVELSGMQIVGWDAANNQIRSWVFDSNGGFGEGVWTADGDNWTIESTGSLPDGRKTSATNLLKKIDDHSYTWQSINRVADGELQPNVDEVLIVREAAEEN